ncbi:MAG: YcxB family protein [Candidatus Hydrogenedentes bacterium]|nr:YcxB family protein [Candidatus Hydrogenedentota bacterium]
MQLEFTVTQDDFLAYSQWHYRRSAEGRYTMRRLYIIGVIIFIAFGVMEYDNPDYGAGNPTRYALYLGITAGALIIVYGGYLRLIRPMLLRSLSNTGRFKEMLGATAMSFDARRISVENPHGRGRTEWRSIQQIAETKDHVFLVFGPMQAFVLPKRAFPSPEEADAFVVQARDWQQASR